MGPINDSTWQDHLQPVIDGERKSHGLVPRDYSARPVGHYAHIPKFSLPLIPRTQWPALIQQKTQDASWLSDIVKRAGYSSLDQDGSPLCWCHSSTGGAMAIRALMNEPFVALSAYYVAYKITGGRMRGGDGSESASFIAKNGVADQTHWPQGQFSKSLDTTETEANAAKHKATLVMMDLEPGNWDQTFTALANDFAVVCDYDWWSHSVIGLGIAATDTIIFRNSWGDSYGTNGFNTIQGKRAIPDGQVAIGVMMASTA
jgi:hypothetical protein